jgi:hypothetical protein
MGRIEDLQLMDILRFPYAIWQFQSVAYGYTEDRVDPVRQYQMTQGNRLWCEGEEDLNQVEFW